MNFVIALLAAFLLLVSLESHRLVVQGQSLCQDQKEHPWQEGPGHSIDYRKHRQCDPISLSSCVRFAEYSWYADWNRDNGLLVFVYNDPKTKSIFGWRINFTDGTSFWLSPEVNTSCEVWATTIGVEIFAITIFVSAEIDVEDCRH